MKLSADFKPDVVLETLQERSTVEELATKYEVHPNQIHQRKRSFIVIRLKCSLLDGVSMIKEWVEEQKDRLSKKIGQPMVEIDRLPKKFQKSHLKNPDR